MCVSVAGRCVPTFITDTFDSVADDFQFKDKNNETVSEDLLLDGTKSVTVHETFL